MSIADEIASIIEKKLPEDPNMQLVLWSDLNALQKKLKQLEMELRTKMVEQFFETAKLKEGTNTADLGNGWKLKYKHALNRKFDEAAMAAVFLELDEGLSDAIVKNKPELVIKEYRRLSDKHRAIFDQCLIIKPASPALELVKPKEKK